MGYEHFQMENMHKLLKKYFLRIMPFYVNFGILSFDRWNGMFPNRPVHVHIFLTIKCKGKGKNSRKNLENNF